MACHGGPKVIPDGLVLGLDGANLKSFKGEATTNEIVAVTWSGDGANQASFAIGTVSVTDESLKYKGYETYLWSPGANLNCYLNGGDLSTLRTSTVWTFSCYVKREDGAAITSLSVYMYYPSSDGASAGTIENVGNGWYRVSRTRTGTDNYLSLVGFTGFAANIKYYLSGAQLEKKSYATTPTTTNTTRGTTVATGGGLVDLSGRGNNGELVNGVRESSDNGGSLSFDGVDDYVNLGSFFNYTNFTISLWVYPGSTQVQYADIFDNNHTGGQNFVCQQNSTTTNQYSFSCINATNGSGTSVFNLTANTWTFLTFTWNNSVASAYINGVFHSSGAAANPINYSSQYLRLGTWGGGGRNWNGRISNFIAHNRVLTASEIQQNYIATKSRYGL